ncbi:unnamed protein product [Bursaphelenchus xylophilus]|uniref:(pine wood nematode) hypothetical protein n=1 Tax=Bursaphelenchus xylophilus TaxID=6326 RepID=A0A1I7SM14_BURXY|nr:unnamed protein product [Bursaphelenchus xylophilus]CAG9129960.1 unnamed protein product [Bursaphelenchus xylophilus]
MARYRGITFLYLTCILQLQIAHSIVHFFSADDLKFTFGVNHHLEVPEYSHAFPSLRRDSKGTPIGLEVDINDKHYSLSLQSVTNQLVDGRATVVSREGHQGGGKLEFVGDHEDCHYHHESNHTMAAISTCDDTLKGTIITEDGIFVIHPIPEKHMNRIKRSADGMGLHVIYKRSVSNDEFCGLDNTITSEELLDDEAGINEDVFVTGERLVQGGQELVVELAIFVDELLWRHFNSQYGGAAWQKLQQYAVTMLNNIQIMYKQPSAVPRLYFRIVRYEVFKTQPSAMAPHLHNNGHAQMYLDRFCKYQRGLGVRDWDHALLLTGYDIHRGTGSRSISGIARLDGMCDPWNTCTLAEGLDFTSAFIGTHELGHSVGMRHDEPYCASTFIMSSSLGPGKVTWSTCSLRDYHTFLQRLDARGKNCLRTSYMPEKVPLSDAIKPGQLYDANTQCMLMHGPGYIQVKPKQDHYDGICYMMWCGLGQFGRIITSHPALEGTFCGPNKWCQLGRCVPWSPSAPTPAATVAPSIPAPVPTRVDGQWSAWSGLACSQCSCTDIIGAIGVTMSTRTCSNPTPANGGSECTGSKYRAVVCNKNCRPQTLSVNQYITNKCSEHKRIKNDPELTGTGSQLTRHPQRACKVFCDVKNTFGGQRNYRFYGDNLPDGTPCGWDRYCLSGECLDLSCDSQVLLARDLGCPAPADRCPLNAAPAVPANSIQGVWGVWSLWSSCTVSCGGGGYQIRSRTCSILNKCEGQATERVACGQQACPVPSSNEPAWTDWTSWNQCSVSCGRGSQARYRRCQTPQTTIAFSCAGQTMDIRNCEELVCSVRPNNGIGNWANWGEWGTCSASCGPGTQTRQRFCTREPCDGSGTQRMACNLMECGSWTQWSLWSECSRLCGRGIRTRSRGCPNNACTGPAVEQGFCNDFACQSGVSNGQWSGWSEWGVCSVSCGAGVRRRTRHCQSGNCPGDFRQQELCNEGSCQTTNANWGGWGYWSACSETCGQGVRRRIRKCYGFGSCAGTEFEREGCTQQAC